MISLAQSPQQCYSQCPSLASLGTKINDSSPRSLSEEQRFTDVHMFSLQSRTNGMKVLNFSEHFNVITKSLLSHTPRFRPSQDIYKIILKLILKKIMKIYFKSINQK